MISERKGWEEGWGQREESHDCWMESSRLYSSDILESLSLGQPGVEHNQKLQKPKAREKQRFSSVKSKLGERAQGDLEKTKNYYLLSKIRGISLWR